MKLKIAVCDDDASERAYLYELAASWAARNHRHLTEIKQYAGADAFLFDYAAEKDFDILLLDIEMPGTSGIELAKAVRRENSAVQIVFVTGFYEYFSDGFDVSALHYLIKPVDAAKLFPVLDKAVRHLSDRQRSILLATADGDIKVSLADILYIESENVYVIVHTAHGNYRTRTPLGKFAGQLDDTFYRVHRSFIVGLKYIKKITRTDLTMTNGSVVPISRGTYHDIPAALIRYL